MTTNPTPGFGADPSHALPSSDLAAAGAELAAVVNELALDRLSARTTPGFRLLGAGNEQIEARLTDSVEPATRRSAWSMQPIYNFDPVNSIKETNERSITRGIDLHLITTERTLHLNPLFSSEVRTLRIGPAPFQFILVDESVAVVAGPLNERGLPTAWLATRSDVVQRVAAIWHDTWRRSRPAVPEGTSPPFSPRQCLVARRMVVGTKDTAIARELGVSLRTVATEIAHVLRMLGARNRSEAILLLRGGGDGRAQSVLAPYLRPVP